MPAKLKKTQIGYALDMNGYTGGHASAAGADAVLPGGGRGRNNERQSTLWLVLLVVAGLAGCQKPAPAPPQAEPAENTLVLPAPPKSYTARANDRLVLIKDRLQLLKDQAAPLSGPTLRMADARIKSIEAEVHAADKEVGHLRRQTIPPAQQAVLNRQLGQIEQDIDATSQAIASSQGRR